MIGQITPLVKVAGYRTWLQSIVAHTAGALVSAGLLGLAVGVIGGWVPLPRSGAIPAVALGAVFLLCGLKEAEMTSCPLPALQRQTPKNFLCAFGPIWGAFVWGLDLGQGWTTYIDYYGYYALVAWTFAAGSPTTGAVTMGSYGLGRVLPVVLVGLAPGRTAAGVFGSRYLAHHWLVRRVNALALVAVGAFVVSGALFGHV